MTPPGTTLTTYGLGGPIPGWSEGASFLLVVRPRATRLATIVTCVTPLKLGATPKLSHRLLSSGKEALPKISLASYTTLFRPWHITKYNGYTNPDQWLEDYRSSP